MTKAEIKKFLNLMGVGDAYSEGAQWVMCSCPFASIAHKSGEDRHYSFGIKAGADSHYNCFACEAKGRPYALVLELREQFGQGAFPYGKLVDFVIECDSSPSLELSFDLEKKEDVVEFYPEAWYSSFLPAYDHPYLKSRGVGFDIAKSFDLRYDIPYDRIVIPVRDAHGRLIAVQARNIIVSDIGRKYEFIRPKGFKFNRNFFWGVQWVDWDNTVAVVEGPFDLLRLYPFYTNVLCGFGTEFNKKKIKILERATRLVTLFDRDEAGDKARSYLSKKLPVCNHWVPSWDDDIGGMPDEQLNELSNSLLKGFNHG